MAYDVKKLYEGKYVVLYLTGMNVAAVGPGGDEINISSMIEGYVVDIDEEYVHLGNIPTVVDRSINIDVIGIIELHENVHENTLLDEIKDDGRVIN